jgi:hypothetical protein
MLCCERLLLHSQISLTKKQSPRLVSRAFYLILAEIGGFAYIPHAAVWLASQTLRILHAKSAGTSLLSAKKMPLAGHLFWRPRRDCLTNSLSFQAPCFWWGWGFELGAWRLDVQEFRVRDTIRRCDSTYQQTRHDNLKGLDPR